MKKLTEKEEGFAQSVLIEKSISDAYRKNYKADNMKPATVNRRAKEVVDKPHVAARIAELKEARNERTGIDADYVLNRLADFDQTDPIDILNDDGSFKPITEWPKAWRLCISGVEMAELMEGYGDDKKVIGVLKKIKWPDKIKILELIGKHVNVQAFKEKVEVTGQLEVTNRILEARKRARAGSET